MAYGWWIGLSVLLAGWFWVFVVRHAALRFCYKRCRCRSIALLVANYNFPHSLQVSVPYMEAWTNWRSDCVSVGVCGCVCRCALLYQTVFYDFQFFSFARQHGIAYRLDGLFVCLFGLLLPSNSLRYREYGYVPRYVDSSWICVKVPSLVVAGSKARFVLFYSNPILAQKHATFVPLLFDVAVSMHAVAFMWGIWTDAVEYGIHRHIGVGTGADAASRVPGAVDIIAV